jgi:uncharacterized protein
VGDFARWRQDLQQPAPPDSLKVALLEALRRYFERHGIETDWAGIDAAPLAGLITSLCMICPFEPNEKQALVEAHDLTRQAKLLIALMQMDVLAEGGTSAVRH